MTDVKKPPRPRPLLVDQDEHPPTQRSSEYSPTNLDLSYQVGAMSQQVGVVHREVAMTRRELGELRTFVMGDMAPRISGVEQKTGGLPSVAKKAGKTGALVLAIPVILQIISEFKPNMSGPLQTLIQLFQ